MIRIIFMAALLCISHVSVAKVNLTDQMQADLATYESCVNAMVEKHIASSATATEIARLADRNCSVYHNYFLDRAVALVNQVMPMPENKIQELKLEEMKYELLKEFRLAAESHRDVYRDRLIANIVQARSAP